MSNSHHKPNLDLICLGARAFYAMFHELVEKVKQVNTSSEDPWITTEEAMQLLRINSKTTLKSSVIVEGLELQG